MMIDGRSEILELAPCRGRMAPVASVLSAALTVDVSQRVATEELKQLREALGSLSRTRVAVRYVAAIERNDVGDGDGSGRPDACLGVGEVLSRDVLAEGVFSAAMVLFAASSAFAVSTVFDDPDRGMRESAVAVVLCLP
jgi:hypothetical protein